MREKTDICSKREVYEGQRQIYVAKGRYMRDKTDVYGNIEHMTHEGKHRYMREKTYK